METRYTTDDVWGLSTFSGNRYSKNTSKRCFIEKRATKPKIDDPSIMGYFPQRSGGKCVENSASLHFIQYKSKSLMEISKELPSRKSRKISDDKLISNKENTKKIIDELSLVSHITPPTFFVGSPENYFISHLETRLDVY